MNKANHMKKSPNPVEALTRIHQIGLAIARLEEERAALFLLREQAGLPAFQVNRNRSLAHIAVRKLFETEPTRIFTLSELAGLLPKFSANAIRAAVCGMRILARVGRGQYRVRAKDETTEFETSEWDRRERAWVERDLEIGRRT